MPFIAFLKFKGGGDGIREGEVWIGVGNQAAFRQEMKMSKAEDFGAAFSSGDVGVEVFTGAHGEENSHNTQLGYCNIFDGRFVLG